MRSIRQQRVRDYFHQSARVLGPTLKVAEAVHLGEEGAIWWRADKAESFDKLVVVVIKVRRLRTFANILHAPRSGTSADEHFQHDQAH
eukprot:CAMPEP_0173115540 /NCGR_PEP_ID=MMETSP1102-20130122/48571_1 /TAXON_ID=49646 /ORGANISM="Geminigera sp., Strain Caron Lab Isolate" /LENGTH=87 /DNA_ID=CAMNT_0014018615 /DNA_START=324 /DNA_END=587 /DNA_ORIENTATION=-